MEWGVELSCVTYFCHLSIQVENTDSQLFEERINELIAAEKEVEV